MTSAAAAAAQHHPILSAGFLKEVTLLVILAVYKCVRTIWRAFFPARMKCLAGRTALVTGAGHGIGRELALRLARLGVHVVCWDIDLDTCKQTAEDIKAMQGPKAWAVQCDVSSRRAVALAANQTRSVIGEPVSLLFNNAGILKPCKPFMQQTPAEIENIFRVNVFSQMWMVHEFMEDLTKMPGSHLVSMSSTAGLCGRPNMSTYCSTKFAINGFMEALDMEEVWGSAMMHVTTVFPFTVSTGLVKRPLSRFPALIPFTSPEECAQIILEGVRRNKRTIYVPKHLEPLFALQSILPYDVKLMAFEFLGVGVLDQD